MNMHNGTMSTRFETRIVHLITHARALCSKLCHLRGKQYNLIHCFDTDRGLQGKGNGHQKVKEIRKADQGMAMCKKRLPLIFTWSFHMQSYVLTPCIVRCKKKS